MSTYYAGEYDIVVIGAGHAGCEAGLAAARLGMKTLIFSISLENIANMPAVEIQPREERAGNRMGIQSVRSGKFRREVLPDRRGSNQAVRGTGKVAENKTVCEI